MTLYRRRERFGGVSVKIGIIFSKAGISPNQWTIISLLPAFIALYYLVQENFLAAAFFFLVSAFLDMVDGAVARVMGRVSNLGAYLDTVVDRYVEFLIILGLLFANLPPAYIYVTSGYPIPIAPLILLYLFGGMATTYVKAAAKEKGLIEGSELKGGLLERAERLIILFIGILLASVSPPALSFIILILAILTNISALQRIWIAVRLGRGKYEYSNK
ncbi:MAG: CDP-alcohol phosphatidyltransferase family protein [Candidatus Aenigmarchaeota archaeon]|nr:CDP-alcohol phosphatidyltransferase family protein [Candidatus Aenigmarchaeota archaeon]